MRRQRHGVLVFLLIVADSLHVVATAGGGPRRQTGFGAPGQWCRCAPDQFEATLRTAERDIDLQAGFDAVAAAASSSMPSSADPDGYVELGGLTLPPQTPEQDGGASVGGGGDGGGGEEEVAAGREGDGWMRENPSLSLDPDEFTAESESTTSVYYDYAGGRLATVEHGRQRLRTIVDHAAVR